MKVLVVTVAYKSETTIADTLSSVATQSYPDIEQIIIDGASRDGTLSMVARIERDLRRWSACPIAVPLTQGTSGFGSRPVTSSDS